VPTSPEYTTLYNALKLYTAVPLPYLTRVAWFLTWSWEQLGRSRSEFDEAGEEAYKKQFREVFVESGRLRSVEIFLNFLEKVYQRQPGTLANVLDDFDKGVQWFCNDVDRECSPSLARVRTQLANLRKSYRSDQAQRTLKVSFLGIGLETNCIHHICINDYAGQRHGRNDQA
jgi:hypothetical protein